MHQMHLYFSSALNSLMQTTELNSRNKEELDEVIKDAWHIAQRSFNKRPKWLKEIDREYDDQEQINPVDYDAEIAF